jgi:DNA topoisomerase I
MPKSTRTPAPSPTPAPFGAKVERLQRTGFLRKGRPGGGFRYAAETGERPDAAQTERIRRLTVPPAWTEVAIARSENAPLQAVGRDRAGRWQYLYHPSAVRAREEKKRKRLAEFIRALPALRATVDRGLRGPELSRERVMCAILRILSVNFLRPGSKAYAEQNDSFGLATLRPRHITVRGSRIRFDFPGKSGKRQRHEIVDARVASVVRALLRIPATEVFKYKNEHGSIIDVRRRDINAYIREVMGRRFTAKDFRTWAGTVLCTAGLCNRTLVAPITPRQRRRCLAEELRAVAATLGNTPAVCRASYVSPVVLDAFEGDRLPRRIHPVNLATLSRQKTLSSAERAVLKLLEQ